MLVCLCVPVLGVQNRSQAQLGPALLSFDNTLGLLFYVIQTQLLLCFANHNSQANKQQDLHT